MTGADSLADPLDTLERKLRALEHELAAPAPAPVPGSAPAPTRSATGGTDELARQIDELSRFRDQLQRIGRELEEEYARVLARLGGKTGTDPVVSPPPEPVAEPEPSPEPEREKEVPVPGSSARLAVDAGPFADLDALAAFEQVLAGIKGVEAVEVTGFEGRRSHLDVALGAAVAVEAELRAALGVPVVRAVSEPGRLVVDLGPAA